MKKYARKCDQCSRVFNEGYCIADGEAYFCSQECLHLNMTEKEFQELYEDDLAYWTEWDDEDDYQYYSDGSEVEE